MKIKLRTLRLLLALSAALIIALGGFLIWKTVHPKIEEHDEVVMPPLSIEEQRRLGLNEY